MVRYRPLENSEELLVQLRSTYKEDRPLFLQAPLIQVSEDILEVPVHFHTHDYIQEHRVILDRGNAPSDTFYQKGQIYVGPDSQSPRDKSSLWHDLCHTMVAKSSGKLEYDNFFSSFGDETLTCRIEFWLGFTSGFYTLEETIQYIKEYMFDDAFDYVGNSPTCDSVLYVLKQSRKIALSNDFAVQVARKLKVYSERYLVSKFREGATTCALFG
jgi:hypothetical protein